MAAASAVITATGRSVRPASHQPPATESRAATVPVIANYPVRLACVRSIGLTRERGPGTAAGERRGRRPVRAAAHPGWDGPGCQCSSSAARGRPGGITARCLQQRAPLPTEGVEQAHEGCRPWPALTWHSTAASRVSSRCSSEVRSAIPNCHHTTMPRTAMVTATAMPYVSARRVRIVTVSVHQAGRGARSRHRGRSRGVVVVALRRASRAANAHTRR